MIFSNNGIGLLMKYSLYACLYWDIYLGIVICRLFDDSC